MWSCRWVLTAVGSTAEGQWVPCKARCGAHALITVVHPVPICAPFCCCPAFLSQDVDLDELRIWHGQTVSLGLEADGQPYRFVVQSEPEWRSLKEVLPAAQVCCRLLHYAHRSVEGACEVAVMLEAAREAGLWP